MVNVAGRLDQTLRAAGIPIDGVSIGDPADRATWRIAFQPIATAQQRSDGDAVRVSFDPLAQTVVDAEQAAGATSESRDKDLLATCALVVRAKGLAAWNAMTTQQKADAALAEAAVWASIRVFIDKNL